MSAFLVRVHTNMVPEKCEMIDPITCKYVYRTTFSHPKKVPKSRLKIINDYNHVKGYTFYNANSKTINGVKIKQAYVLKIDKNAKNIEDCEYFSEKTESKD